MKKNRRNFTRKKAVAFIMAMILSFGTVMVTGATESQLPDATERVVAAQPGDCKTANTNSTSSNRSNFYYGQVDFTYHGNYIVEVYSYTMANAVIDRVMTISILERFYNGKWQVYDLKQVTEYGSNIASSDLYLEVPGGYYYRGRSVHSTINDYDETREELYTEYLWVAR